jgi:hypothetical protein
MTKTELKQNITKINKLLRSDSYEAGIELIKTLDDPEITKGTAKAVISKFRKYLICKDWEMVEKAVDMIVTLNDPYVYESLLEGCTHPFYRDNKNKIFSGINSIQPYLDTAFFGVLNNIPNNAKINKALRKENINSFHFPPSDVSQGKNNGGSWYVEDWGYIHKFIWDFLLECRDFNLSLDEEVISMMNEKQYYWFIDKIKKINNNNLFASLLRESEIDNKTNEFKMGLIGREMPGYKKEWKGGGLFRLAMLHFAALAPKNANIHTSIKLNNIKKLNWLDSKKIAYDEWDDYSSGAIQYGTLFSDVINYFPKLESLKLLVLGAYDSKINMVYMETLSKCKNITELNLTDSVFITDFEHFSGHARLEKLNLSNCRKLRGIKGLSGGWMGKAKDKFSLKGIEKIPNLSSLNLSNNGRGGTGYREGWNYGTDGNQFCSNGEDLKIITKCKKLEHLIIMEDNSNIDDYLMPFSGENIELNNQKEILDYVNDVISRDKLWPGSKIKEKQAKQQKEAIIYQQLTGKAAKTIAEKEKAAEEERKKKAKVKKSPIDKLNDMNF